MQSSAADVQTYLQTVPPERHAALTQLRNLCLTTLEGYEECMEYGGPCYKKDGVIEVGWASQKNYIALYILKEDVMHVNQALLQSLNCGKGCIRYSKPAKIDFSVVEKLLIDTVASHAQPC